MGRPLVLTAVARAGVEEALRDGERASVVAASFGISERYAQRIGEQDRIARRRVSHSGFRLTYRERLAIEVRLEHGEGVRAIARGIARPACTVSREIGRNGGQGRYQARRAEARAQACAVRPKDGKLTASPGLRVEVEDGLARLWSPEQIAATCKRAHPDDPSMQISHESIYRALYVQSRGELNHELAGCLRTARTARKPQGRTEKRGQLVGMVPIAERPPEVDDRRVPGHWEGDLIIGAGGASAIITLVERQTRYVMLAPLLDRTTEHVTTTLGDRIRGLPEHVARSLTWDQGRELAAHARFTERTGIPVYFCDPHSPWQRGSNENTNGLLRQYLPKGTDLSVHDQAALDAIAYSLNGRPRKTLEWDTPAERMAMLLGEDGGTLRDA
jgi:IS30 family transposase